MLNLWFASLPLEYNPFLDQHLFYAVAALSVLAFDSGRYLGLATPGGTCRWCGPTVG